MSASVLAGYLASLGPSTGLAAGYMISLTISAKLEMFPSSSGNPHLSICLLSVNLLEVLHFLLFQHAGAGASYVFIISLLVSGTVTLSLDPSLCVSFPERSDHGRQVLQPKCSPLLIKGTEGTLCPLWPYRGLIAFPLQGCIL